MACLFSGELQGSDKRGVLSSVFLSLILLSPILLSLLILLSPILLSLLFFPSIAPGNGTLWDRQKTLPSGFLGF